MSTTSKNEVHLALAQLHLQKIYNHEGIDYSPKTSQTSNSAVPLSNASDFDPRSSSIHVYTVQVTGNRSKQALISGSP